MQWSTTKATIRFGQTVWCGSLLLRFNHLLGGLSPASQQGTKQCNETQSLACNAMHRILRLHSLLSSVVLAADHTVLQLQSILLRTEQYGVHRTRRDGSSFLWHQPCQRCKYTTSVDIKKKKKNAL